MNNFVLFLNSFLSYGFVYIIFIACVVVSVFAGIALRKNKDKKAVTEKVEGNN